MTEKKLWKQFIAAMVAITLTVTTINLPVYAAPVDTETSDTAEESAETEETVEESNDSEEESAKILSEVEDEREEDQKTFLMSDGTFMVAQYGTPVHYEDQEGRWEDIDYSLEAETVTNGTEPQEVYTTTEKAGSRDRIKFSKKLKEGKTVSIKNTEFPLSWGLKGAKKQTVQIEAAEAIEAKNWNDQFLFADTNAQVLTYAEVYDGVDIEYQVQSGGIKENIILKEKGTANTYEIVYDIGKLEAVQVDERTIQLLGGEDIVYQICAPYMMDANGEQSDGLTLSMEQTKKKEITVTMTADQDWLQAEERAYPVVLDPSVYTETDINAIDSTFITSERPSTNYVNTDELIVGRESSAYGYCRILLKVELPDLNPGDMVVDAKMYMKLCGMDVFIPELPDQQVNVHRITESWEIGGVTWNTRPNVDSTVLDYNYFTGDDKTLVDITPFFKKFDITEAVKGWYEESYDNYGVELKLASESGSYEQNGMKALLCTEKYNENKNNYPYYTITYRNNKGLEDYWTYTSLSAGTAGTAYINDYTGNLVFIHDDVSTTGELLPVTLQHVYNGYFKDQKFAGSYPSAGRGWKLSVQQTLLSSSTKGLTGNALEQSPYVYEDGDGTEHFFYMNEEGKLLDEDGLGLELTISGTTKTITDKDKNVMTFGAKGNLTSIRDVKGNTITVAYKTVANDKKQITKVTDGAGHVLTLEEHNTDTYNLKTIEDPAGRKTTYSYTIYDTSNGNRSVSRIDYPDGTYSRYSYDTDGTLTEAKSSDGSKLKFTYTQGKMGKRVKKVEEYGTDGTIGQTITFDRSKYNTTVIRTTGEDDVINTGDDLLTTLQFDNFGRTINSNTRTADNSVYYGGDLYSYTAGEVNESGSNIQQLNRLSQSAYSTKAVRNYLKNHSAETDGNWTPTYWISASSEYTAVRSTEQSYYGKSSLKIIGENVESNGGAVFNQHVSTDLVQPGNTYTFSAYVKTSEVTKDNNVNAGYGAGLAVRFISSDGTLTRKYSDYVKGTTATGYQNGWRRLSLTFTVPDDTEEVRVYTLLRNAIGTAYFDGMQVEIGGSANPYNLLNNTSFETGTTTPTGWTIENGESGDGTSETHYLNGSKALKLSGKADTNKYAYQEVDVTGKESDIYVISGWAWAEALQDMNDIKRHFDIFIRVYYLDDSGNVVSKQKKTQAMFNRDVNGWQRTSMAFDLSDNDKSTNWTPTKIRVVIRYYKQENAAWFDNFQLIKDVSNSYTYDDEGNLITTIENGENSSALSYDDDNNLTSVQDAENNLYEYTYNADKQVTKATAPQGQTISYSYKSKGPLHYSIISSEDEAWKIRAGYVYNAASGNISEQAYVTEVWDQNEYKTVYDIDLDKGLTNSVTTPEGTKTSYTYNANNDLLMSIPA